MKVALISYHKNIKNIYPQEWIDRYRDSIEKQTYQGFTIMELNYGGDNERIFKHSFFESYPYPTFVHAMNYLLDKCFSGGYDYVANTNCDDSYSPLYLEKLLSDIKRGFDLVSCNFCLVKDNAILKCHKFHTLDIASELEKNHNIISHPSLIYSKRFWQNNRYDPDEIPVEDLLLWKRALKNGMKFFINEENLLSHRLHSNSVCQSNNR